MHKYPPLTRVFETGDTFKATIAATHFKERSAAAWRVEDLSGTQDPIFDIKVSERESTHIRGVIRSLLRVMEVVPDAANVTIFSNNEHVVDAVNGLLAKWTRAGWKSKGGPLKNADLWKDIDALWSQKKLTLKAVQAKKGSPEMAEIDELREQARQLLRQSSAA